MHARVPMRWWLTAAFALVAAVTAFATALVSDLRTEEELRKRAGDLAAGNAVQAAIEIGRVRGADERRRVLEQVANRRRLTLFVFDRSSRLVSPPRSRSVLLRDLADRTEAVSRALAGRRYLETNDEARATTVALPLAGRGALLAYASHPELAAELGIVEDELVEAAVWAVLVGGAVGFVIASLIGARLRRIAAAAARIERGEFETPLTPGFRDELGDLAASTDRMRTRLRDSFLSLEVERDRLADLVERLHEGVVSVDRDLRVELVNERARSLLESPSLKPGDRLPETALQPQLHTLARSVFGPGADAVETRATAGERSFRVMVVPPRDPSGTAVLVLDDVSERERAERAEREFVANAAHELRTPLATIIGAVEALDSGAKDDARQRDRFLTHIGREARRLARLSRALLMLARAQTGSEPVRRVPVLVRPLLDEVAASLDASRTVAVTVDAPAELAAAGERDLLEQAVANVAGNAAKYTREGEIRLVGRPAADRVSIEVADTGPGMGAEERKRAFDRFYRPGSRNANGFGLGLAIVRQAVEALDGTVELLPSERGTHVRITVPRADGLAP